MFSLLLSMSEQKDMLYIAIKVEYIGTNTYSVKVQLQVSWAVVVTVSHRLVNKINWKIISNAKLRALQCECAQK